MNFVLFSQLPCALEQDEVMRQARCGQHAMFYRGGHASTARRQSLSCLQHRMVCQNSLFPRAKLARYVRYAVLAHDPAEEREGVAASDFLDVRVGVPPLDETTDDVLAIRG